MPRLTSGLQVRRLLRLSVGTRQTPPLTPRSGTQRARDGGVLIRGGRQTLGQLV
jgi:hypothetical protein